MRIIVFLFALLGVACAVPQNFNNFNNFNAFRRRFPDRFASDFFPHSRNFHPNAFGFQGVPQRFQSQFQTPFVQRSFGPNVALIRSSSQGPNLDGSYQFDFASEDGIQRTEQGRLKDPVTMEVTGSYSYTSPEGVPVHVNYIADEFGFRTDSSHNLPVGPAAPPHSVAQVKAAQEQFARRGLHFRSPFAK